METFPTSALIVHLPQMMARTGFVIDVVLWGQQELTCCTAMIAMSKHWIKMRSELCYLCNIPEGTEVPELCNECSDNMRFKKECCCFNCSVIARNTGFGFNYCRDCILEYNSRKNR
jgi:hypothetical protein